MAYNENPPKGAIMDKDLRILLKELGTSIEGVGFYLKHEKCPLVSDLMRIEDALKEHRKALKIIRNMHDRREN